MNPFVLDSRSLMTAWKNCRNSVRLCDSSLMAMETCLNFWKGAPLENHHLDWDNSSSWPKPWDLINTNRFCASTLSLAVAWTLVLADAERFDDVDLLLITNKTAHVQKIVVRTGAVILNHGWLDLQSREILKQCHTHKKWVFNGKIWVGN
jgi:hypothetical protein